MWRMAWRYCEKNEWLHRGSSNSKAIFAAYARASYSMLVACSWFVVGGFVGFSGVLAGALSNAEAGAVTHWFCPLASPLCATVMGLVAGCHEVISRGDTQRREAIMLRWNGVLFVASFLTGSWFMPFADMSELPPAPSYYLGHYMNCALRLLMLPREYEVIGKLFQLFFNNNSIR